jgi:hypothetical protein
MSSSTEYRDTLITVAITFLIYMVLQAAIVIMHEYTHAVSAWILGYSPTPFTVIWGSVLTLRGFDEGVPYDQLFPVPGNPAEAVIGFMPCVIHIIMVTAGLLLLQRPWIEKRKWVFIVLFLWTVMNLAELISYIVMRPFPYNGDTGRFNAGLAISPWFLFVIGSGIIVLALWVLFRKILPIMNDVVAQGNRTTYWAFVVGSGFILFLWGSAFRVMPIYPDPAWVFGLIGIPAFVIWITVAIMSPAVESPARQH